MGSCQCGCLADKQEKSAEIGTDPLKPIEHQDKSTQAEPIAPVQITPVLLEVPISLPVNPEKTPKPKINLSPLHLQAVFRSYISRKAYLEYLKIQPQPIPEIPPTISTLEAKQAYARLAPFKFERPAGDETVSWKGPTKLLDGSVYVGEWSIKGMPHGKGIMYYIDGGICEGYWKEGKLHDRGRRVSPKGDVYTGNWNNGEMNGQGSMEYVSRIVYTGGWLNSKQHGIGIEAWPDGSKFEGVYVNGVKSGKGKFFWPDGTKYEGDFTNDVIEGYGIYVWANKVYEGNWKDSKMHGKGIFKWNDGKSYDGEYNMDVKEGFGIFKWPDGRRYEGYWKDGKQHGEGVIYNKMKKRCGVWENGVFKQKIKGEVSRNL